MNAGLAFRSRVLVALLAASLALSGTGAPCLFACAAETHEHHDSGPDPGDVVCGSDPAPAILAHAVATTALSDLGVVLPVALPSPIATLAAPARTAIQLPDRSPPVPPGFVVLRI